MNVQYDDVERTRRNVEETELYQLSWTVSVISTVGAIEMTITDCLRNITNDDTITNYTMIPIKNNNKDKNIIIVNNNKTNENNNNSSNNNKGNDMEVVIPEPIPEFTSKLLFKNNIGLRQRSNSTTTSITAISESEYTTTASSISTISSTRSSTISSSSTVSSKCKIAPTNWMKLKTIETCTIPTTIHIPMPNIAEIKKQRKAMTVIMGVATGVAGLFVLGPIGGVAAGIAGAIAIKSIGKKLERRMMKKYGKKVAAQLLAAERQAFDSPMSTWPFCRHRSSHRRRRRQGIRGIRRTSFIAV